MEINELCEYGEYFGYLSMKGLIVILVDITKESIKVFLIPFLPALFLEEIGFSPNFPFSTAGIYAPLTRFNRSSQGFICTALQPGTNSSNNTFSCGTGHVKGICHSQASQIEVSSLQIHIDFQLFFPTFFYFSISQHLDGTDLIRR